MHILISSLLAESTKNKNKKNDTPLPTISTPSTQIFDSNTSLNKRKPGLLEERG